MCLNLFRFPHKRTFQTRKLEDENKSQSVRYVMKLSEIDPSYIM